MVSGLRWRDSETERAVLLEHTCRERPERTEKAKKNTSKGIEEREILRKRQEAERPEANTPETERPDTERPDSQRDQSQRDQSQREQRQMD